MSSSGRRQAEPGIHTCSGSSGMDPRFHASRGPRMTNRVWIMRNYYVYITASRKNGTLYVGVTNGIARRSSEHRNGTIGGFTEQHKVRRLVYVETCQDIREAIQREKTLKKWKRQYKIDLIESVNPDWNDLYNNL